MTRSMVWWSHGPSQRLEAALELLALREREHEQRFKLGLRVLREVPSNQAPNETALHDVASSGPMFMAER